LNKDKDSRLRLTITTTIETIQLSCFSSGN